jgi:hypothetical protein
MKIVPIEIVVTQPAEVWIVIRPNLTEFRMEVEMERIPVLIDRTLTS